MKKTFRAFITHRMERFEQFTLDVIYERRKGLGISCYGAFLSGLSVIFSGLVQLRQWLYCKRILRPQHLGCLVVVVGNLTVGGTGKTPVVEKFARALADQGRKVAILSRGYKSKNEPLLKRWQRSLLGQEPIPPKVVSDGKTIYLDSETAGDEPYMLARNLPGVMVFVDKNRVKAGQYAIKNYQADTLILDDGFQYFTLKGQLNLLLIDCTNPFGNGRLLPRGVLREPVKHVARASYIFLTKSDGSPPSEIKECIETYQPKAEIIECEHKAQYLQAVNTEERLPLKQLHKKRIAVFSAIAAPESFEASLRSFCAEIVYQKRFLDHHRYTERDIRHIFRHAERVKPDLIVTTEKDAVRLPPSLNPPYPLYFLRLEINIISGEEDFDAAVSRLCRLMHPRKVEQAMLLK